MIISIKRYAAFVLTLIFALSFLDIKAVTLEDAKQEILYGDYNKGASLLKEALKSNPKFEKNPLSDLLKGRIAFFNYDFEEASDLFSKYLKGTEKAKQHPENFFEDWERELQIAEGMIERVQNITIIDSISVPAINFFEYYKLAPSAGKILSPENVPIDGLSEKIDVAYMSEGEDYMIVSVLGENGNYTLQETSRLLGKGWQNPSLLPSTINGNFSVSYPFMMPDGSTLYFAADGDDSIGGYDIFVAQRDAVTDEYLQPLNIGMPFNSPFNDYMMAYDEDTGVGWWATDRNSIPGNVTIYVFVIDDIRKNYGFDEENIEDLAKIKNYRNTQSPEMQDYYAELRNKISNLGTETNKKVIEFEFPMGNGRVYHLISDFKNREAGTKMKQYIEKEESLRKNEIYLHELRKKYFVKNSADLAQKIQLLEKKVDEQRIEIKNLKLDIYRLEKSGRTSR